MFLLERTVSLNPLTPKNYWLIILLYIIFLESKVKFMRIKEKVPGCQTNSPCPYIRGLKENSAEIMKTNPWI